MGADLCVAVFGGGVVPGVALAGDEIAGEIGEIVDRGRAGETVGVVAAVAPVGQRPVDVDADGVDIGARPQRVEVEVDVARAVGRVMAEVLRPVGSVGDFGGGAEDGFHIGGQIRQRRNEGIGAGAVTHGGEAAHFRADDERVDTAGSGGEVGVMQDEAAVRPLGRAGVGDGCIGDVEVWKVGETHEGGDLEGGGGALVGRAGLAGRGRDGDAAAPGVGRLDDAARVGIGQHIVRRHVHEDEGRERDFEPAVVEILDGGNHRLVGRRAAVGRAIFDGADEMRILAREAGDAPRERLGDLVRGIDAGAQLACARAQIGAEPADDEGDRARVGESGLQLVDGDGPVGTALARVHVLRDVGDGADFARDGLLGVDELARTGDQRDGAHAGFERVDGAVHLEGKLRNAIAEIGERQALEHEVGDAAVGRRVAHAFARFDQAVGRLAVAAGVEAVCEG